MGTNFYIRGTTDRWDDSGHVGKRSCSAFTWGINPHTWQAVVEQEAHVPHPDDSRLIENEYGELFTIQEFAALVDECLVQYTHLIGTPFC